VKEELGEVSQLQERRKRPLELEGVFIWTVSNLERLLAEAWNLREISRNLCELQLLQQSYPERLKRQGLFVVVFLRICEGKTCTWFHSCHY
jgi:hypothetical protein